MSHSTLVPRSHVQILIEFCLTSNEFILGVDQVGHWGLCGSRSADLAMDLLDPEGEPAGDVFGCSVDLLWISCRSLQILLSELRRHNVDLYV